MRILTPVALAAVIIAVLAGGYFAWSDCAEAGGVLVRGLVWFECVSRK